MKNLEASAFETPEVEIVSFENDVIATSCTGDCHGAYCASFCTDYTPCPTKS